MQLYKELLLTGDHALIPAVRIKQPSVTLSVDHNSKAARLTSSCEGFYEELHIQHYGWDYVVE